MTDWYVDPDAVGGGTGVDWANAYTALETALAAKEGDITGDESVIFHCDSTGGSADTIATVIDGWTTDATHTLTIQVEAANRSPDGVYDTSKYRLELSQNTSGVIALSNDYVFIYGLQIYQTLPSGTGFVIRQTDGENCEVGYCICRTLSSYNYGNGIHLEGGGNVVSNTIFNTTVYANYGDRGSQSEGLFMETSGGGSSLTAYNVTVYNFNDCCERDDETFDITNSAVFGGADDFDGSITIVNCASDSGSGSNPQTLNNTSDYGNEFVDITTGDFDLVIGGVCIENGIDDPWTYSDDIIGTTRVSPWDISAFAVPAGGISYLKYINEAVDLTENLFKAMAYNRLIFSTVGLQENISRNRTMIRFFAETIDLVEVAFRKSTLKRSINESLDIVEGIATQLSTMIKQFINETVDLIETTYRKSALKRFISSTIDLTENIKPVRALKRIISEVVGLAESVKSARIMKRLLTSTVQIDENLNRKKTMTRTLSEVLGITEIVATVISATLIKIISEIIGIDESVATHISATLIKIISETVDIVEAIGSSISAALKKYINEIINLTETVKRKGTLKRILSESIDIIESIVYPRTLKRIISATVELIESSRSVRGIVRKLSSTITIIESLVRLKTMKRIISENISIIESIRTTIGAALAIIYQDFRNVFTFDNLRRIFRIDR